MKSVQWEATKRGTNTPATRFYQLQQLFSCFFFFVSPSTLFFNSFWRLNNDSHQYDYPALPTNEKLTQSFELRNRLSNSDEWWKQKTEWNFTIFYISGCGSVFLFWRARARFQPDDVFVLASKPEKYFVFPLKLDFLPLLVGWFFGVNCIIHQKGVEWTVRKFKNVLEHERPGKRRKLWGKIANNGRQNVDGKFAGFAENCTTHSNQARMSGISRKFLWRAIKWESPCEGHL